jgi:hypothetical protein
MVRRRPSSRPTTGDQPSAAVVGQEAPDLALGRSEPLRIAFHPHRPAGELPDELNEVADADFPAAAEVDRLADGARLGPGPHETVHRVGDEIQVARRMQAAQLDGRAGQALTDDGRDDGAGRLAGAEGVERPHRDYRKLVGAGERLGQLVRSDLTGRVRRLPL